MGRNKVWMGAAESAINALIRRAASAYIAGPSLEDARTVCDRLAHEGIASTICYWDVYADQPRIISQAYLGALGAMTTRDSDCYLSIKAPALKFDSELVKKVLEEARRLNAIVHFDAMSPETVDRTFDLIVEARSIYAKLGCTLPGRWGRSLTDADRAIELGLRVRVVKGEWKGIGEDETDPREGFLNVVERLAGRATHVAVATHNPTMARFALRKLKNAGTSCELELLYGLPQKPLLQIAKDLNVRARMYVPYGHNGLPYRLKNAMQQPRIFGWFLHDLLRGSKRP
jgi:proline dehydrogenase